MKEFQKQLAPWPLDIKQAWSIGFVFVREKEHYWHFPARQWTEQQIQDYFFKRFGKEGRFISYPELSLKQLRIDEIPELLIIIPYDPRKEKQ